MKGKNAAGFKTCLRQQAETNRFQLYLYDDIEEYGDWNWETWDFNESETSAKHIRDVLAAVPEDAELEVFINSNGGDVKEGIAIFNQLKRHPAQKTGYVDGVAHSIAFVIFQACDKRIMGEGTSALIHEIWGRCAGNAKEFRKYADQLDAMMQSNRALFMQRAKNITEKKLAELMAEEHILTPEEALEYGFCDEIAQREKKPEPNPEFMQGLKAVRNQIRTQQSFQEELKEFDRNCKKEKKEEESVNLMDAFFNAFI